MVSLNKCRDAHTHVKAENIWKLNSNWLTQNQQNEQTEKSPLWNWEHWMKSPFSHAIHLMARTAPIFNSTEQQHSTKVWSQDKALNQRKWEKGCSAALHWGSWGPCEVFRYCYICYPQLPVHVENLWHYFKHKRAWACSLNADPKYPKIDFCSQTTGSQLRIYKFNVCIPLVATPQVLEPLY